MDNNPNVIFDVTKSAKTYIRFRTPYMDSVIEDTPGFLSGWNTANHYFYEVRNYDGKFIFTQLAFSSKNLVEDQRVIMDEIDHYYPAKKGKENWQWRLPFRTQKYYLDEDSLEESVKEAMDKCIEEILAFEKELKAILQNS